MSLTHDESFVVKKKLLIHSQRVLYIIFHKNDQKILCFCFDQASNRTH